MTGMQQIESEAEIWVCLGFVNTGLKTADARLTLDLTLSWGMPGVTLET